MTCEATDNDNSPAGPLSQPTGVYQVADLAASSPLCRRSLRCVNATPEGSERYPGLVPSHRVAMWVTLNTTPSLCSPLSLASAPLEPLLELLNRPSSFLPSERHSCLPPTVQTGRLAETNYTSLLTVRGGGGQARRHQFSPGWLQWS